MQTKTVSSKDRITHESWGGPMMADEKATTIALTLLELLLVISVTAILMTLSVAAVSKTTRSKKQIVCVSNLKQIGTLISLYAQDNQNAIPPCIDFPQNRHWTEFLSAYYLNGRETISAGPMQSNCLICPAWSDSPDYRPKSYWIGGYGLNLSPGLPANHTMNLWDAGSNGTPNNPRFLFQNAIAFTNRILVGDSCDWMYTDRTASTQRHGAGCNALFFDMSVRAVSPDQAKLDYSNP